MFERFNNSAAVIIKHGNYDSFNNSSEPILLGEIDGDLQPFGGDLANKEYGYQGECEYQFFCKANKNIEVGNYLKIDCVEYLIVYVAPWRMGLEVLLREGE